jgi:cyanuric acid amidohydrolase
MNDSIDTAGIYEAITDAGLDLPERPTAADLGERLVNCFIKCEADPSGRLRGRRQVSLNDSDVHHTHHIKAAVGGVAAAATGDPCVYVSVAARQQGPAGGGTVAAIVDLGE